MLFEKNRAYGDSALAPVRVFSKAPTDEQIRVRLDDKISRLMRGEAAGEDPEWDLMGYLVLLRVVKRRSDKALVTMVDMRPVAPAPVTLESLGVGGVKTSWPCFVGCVPDPTGTRHDVRCKNFDGKALA